jgi:hypothetical protein
VYLDVPRRRGDGSAEPDAVYRSHHAPIREPRVEADGEMRNLLLSTRGTSAIAPSEARLGDIGYASIESRTGTSINSQSLALPSRMMPFNGVD